MVFVDESRASWLFGAFRRSASFEKKAASSDSRDSDGSDSERGFDIADAMEQGLAREFVTDFMHPLQHTSKLWKFHVERSDCRRQYRLFCDSGEFLMYAQVSKDTRHVDFLLYDPRAKENNLFDAAKPAFTMDCDSSRKEWIVMQERCDNCRHSGKSSRCSCGGRRELLSACHTEKTIGDGVNHCFDVCVAANGNWPEQNLVTKLPVWNDVVESLVLDFRGRKILASAKNFQLAPEAKPEQVVCQHGKIASNTFALDFKFPLTVIQAFGLSLATLHWA